MRQRFFAAAALLSLCAGLPAAADELLVSAWFSNQVFRYDLNTGAALGAFPVPGPQCMLVGPDGRLYIAAEGENSVRRYDVGTLTQIDTFVASSAGGLSGPCGIVFNPAGDLLAASFNTDQILKYAGASGSPLGALVTTNSGGLNGPDNGLVFGPGALYSASYYTNAVLKYDGLTGAALGAFAASGSGGLVHPRAVVFRPDAAYVASEGSARVVRYNRLTGASLGSFATTGLSGPAGLAWDASGRMLVSDSNTHSIRRYDGATGALVDVLIPPGAGGMSGPTFLKVIPRPQFTQTAQFGTGNTICVAWGDWNLDGRPDVAVGLAAPQHVGLYTNNGDGTFAATTPFGATNTFAVVWGDANNDGRPDLAVAGYNAPSRVLINNGDGTWTPQVLPGPSLRTIGLAWADFDNDGDLDLAAGAGILGVAQPNYLYVNSGNGTWTARPEFGAGQTDSVAWGDFDNDGDQDLAVGNGGYAGPGQNALYTNNGDGTFTGRDEFGLGDTASISWGDFDNDGFLDLAVGNWGGDASMLYANNRDGTFTGRREFGARDTNTVAWGDYNNDGFLDLAAGNGDFQSADQNYLYVNNGDSTFTEVPAFGQGSTDGLAFADYNNDGRLDMAAGNEHSPAINALFTNTDAGPRWLGVRLVGHRHDRGPGFSNRDGIGARIWVYAAGHIGDPQYLRGYRQIVAGGGFTSQNFIEEHLGLPMDASVDIRIAWPGSGGTHVTQEVVGITANQRLTVHETGPCYANCDGSTTVPILNITDFSCFLNRFAAGEPYANCDGSTTPPVLNVADFSCFLNAFAAGCS